MYWQLVFIMLSQIKALWSPPGTKSDIYCIRECLVSFLMVRLALLLMNWLNSYSEVIILLHLLGNNVLNVKRKVTCIMIFKPVSYNVTIIVTVLPLYACERDLENVIPEESVLSVM